jgi:antitoxin ParD1/3/4
MARLSENPQAGFDNMTQTHDLGEPPAVTDDTAEAWPTADDWARSLAEAARLMPQAAAGGLRFEVFLPPQLATWVLESIARKDVLTPDEAVLVMLNEMQDLMKYPELRKELLRQSIMDAMDDPAPSIPAEEVFAQLKARAEAPRPEPAVWRRRC